MATKQERIRGRKNAHGKVRYAIKRGVLPPITDGVLCVDCGNQATEYDHRDYNKPLDVEPTCRRCNMRRGPGIDVGERKIHSTRSKAYKIETALYLLEFDNLEERMKEILSFITAEQFAEELGVTEKEINKWNREVGYIPERKKPVIKELHISLRNRINSAIKRGK